MAHKKEQAFRTITEVSNWLDTPSHVLRFWESKFSQIKPVKRTGGRRYYRPEDLKLIGGIKCLLHDKGTTIASVKKLIKSKGEKYVKEYSIQPIFPEKDRRRSAKIKVLGEKSQANQDIDKINVTKEIVTSKIILNDIKSYSNLEKNDMLQIKNLYYQLQHIRNRMKHRLEAL